MYRFFILTTVRLVYNSNYEVIILKPRFSYFKLRRYFVCKRNFVVYFFSNFFSGVIDVVSCEILIWAYIKCSTIICFVKIFIGKSIVGIKPVLSFFISFCFITFYYVYLVIEVFVFRSIDIRITKYKYVSTCVGCGISGLGGLFCVMDYMGGNWEYVLEGFGWLSIALVIFTLWKPALSILGSIIFAGLYIASSYIKGISFAQIELIKLLPYVVTILVLVITSMINKREAQPPAALGMSYFREER